MAAWMLQVMDLQIDSRAPGTQTRRSFQHDETWATAAELVRVGLGSQRVWTWKLIAWGAGTQWAYAILGIWQENGLLIGNHCRLHCYRAKKIRSSARASKTKQLRAADWHPAAWLPHGGLCRALIDWFFGLRQKNSKPSLPLQFGGFLHPTCCETNSAVVLGSKRKTNKSLVRPPR